MARVLRFCVGLSLLETLAAPLVARAQSQPAPTTPTTPTAAATDPQVEALLRRGFELRRAGQDEQAAEQFSEAHRLAPSPRTAANLGLARQSMGAWVEADRLLHLALSAPQDPWVTRNRAALEAALVVVDRHLGTIELRGGVPGAQVRVDGVSAGTLPLAAPLRVLAGGVSVEVSAPGYVTLLRRFVVDPGALVRESLEMRAEATVPEVISSPPARAVPAPVVAPPTAPEQRPAPTSRPFRPWDVVALSVGGGALAVGFAAVLLQRDGASRYNEQCDRGTTEARCVDTERNATGWGTASWVLLPVGGVAAVGGLVMLLWPARSRETRGVTASVSCAPAGLEVACRGAF